MSGIASAAPTIPGSVATFRSCSSDLSASIARRISRSAKTRAGTRIAPDAGISHVASSTDRRSDIEHHPRAKAAVRAFEGEPVERHRFDEEARRRAPALDGRTHARAVELELACALGQEAVRLREEDELGEPVGEERRAVRRLELHPERARLAVGCGPEELAERLERLAKDPLLRLGLDEKLDFGRVVDPAVHVTS